MRSSRWLPLVIVVYICGCASSDVKDEDTSTDASSGDGSKSDTSQGTAGGRPLLFVDLADEHMKPPIPSMGTASLLVDLDQDGDLDVVQASSQGLRFWWNDGLGVFELGQNVKILDEQPSKPVLEAGADADPADGGPDSGGTAPSSSDLHPITAVRQIVAIEGTGSSGPDLFLLCTDETPIRWLKNKGGATFEQTTLHWPLTGHPRHATVADLDGDGSNDLLVTGDVTAETPASAPGVVLYSKSGTDGWQDVTSKRISAPSLRAWASAAGDLDGDGHIDLIFLGDNVGHRLLLNDGAGSYRDAPADTIPELEKPHGRAVALGDINGDGALDIFVASSTSNHVLINDKNGHFANGTAAILGAQPATGVMVRLVDLNGDNWIDAVVASPDGRFYVWKNDGKGRWFDYSHNMAPYPSVVSSVTDIQVGDIDNDGDIDIFANRTSMGRPWLLINWGTGDLTDSDQDGVPNAIDNCPSKANADQKNTDRYPFNCDSNLDCHKSRECELATFEKNVYLLCKKTTNWKSAREFCQSLGSDLVVIETKQENEFITSLKTTIWLGLSDLDAEGVYRWMNGKEEPKTSEFWAPNEPNDANGAEDCCGLYATKGYEGTWNDFNCEAELAFVCEEKLSRGPRDPGDACDVCPTAYDVDQKDSDKDGVGDACSEKTKETP